MASRAGVHWSEVKNNTIWGNHSNTQYPDWHHATIGGRPAAEAIGDDQWLRGEFIRTVQERGKAVIEARGKSSALSAASSAIDHCRSLFNQVPVDDWVSLCTISDGSYDVPEGLISSFPCTTDGRGNWSIVQGLEIADFSREKISVSIQELIEERDTVAKLLS